MTRGNLKDGCVDGLGHEEPNLSAFLAFSSGPITILCPSYAMPQKLMGNG